MGIFDLFKKQKQLSNFQKQQLDNCRRIFAESFKIIQDTKSIDTFLSRYGVLRDSIYEAGRIAGENYPCFHGGLTPAKALEVLDNDFSAEAQKCIDRYMNKESIRISGLKKDRVKKAMAILVVVDNYSDQLPEECLEHWRYRVRKLAQSIERIEQLELDGK